MALTGAIEETIKEPIPTDSIYDIQLEELEGEIAIQDNIVMGFLAADVPPELKTPLKI
ncbi:MAG: hypothetical protein ACJARX_001973 [Psychroserpens sp.]|jgi:hypothetical protein|uniref:hypothetical protein n=1 Tax=Psychroserpens sp. TaxID=2020870 RepID=UPI0039E55B8F